MRYPKYKKRWSTSSENEFGRLANGVSGQIKNPTNTIKFVKKKDVPNNRQKRLHVRIVCMQHAKLEIQEEHNALCGWRRPHKLSRRGGNAHIIYVVIKAFIQQCDINKRRQVHENTHLHFLPNDATQTT